jgi:hypothetical protein
MRPAGAVIPVAEIAQRILTVRGQRVMLDSDLAELYGVTTKRLNEQVRRNRGRFPDDFMFQLTGEEATNLRSQFATSKIGRGGRRYAPHVFTEHGAMMLASVLNTTRAVDVSVYVVRAFVRLREMMVANTEVAAKLGELDRKVAGHDDAIRSLVQAIRELMATPQPRRRAIGFRVEEGRPAYRTRRPGGRRKR